MQKVLIIGAGPAGLTAAYELMDKSKNHEVIVFEESNCFGGISRTVNYKGNRMDMGGHRFFSKVPEVNDWWQKMLPTQGAMPYDDVVLGRSSTVVPNGPDPEKTDRVMLRRNRLSRIFFNSKFFDYPISLKFSTIKNMGFGTTIVVGFSYLKTIFHKREEKTLEDFYINRFGKKLYSMFFENYTENLWGRHPSEISPEWGAQRVKGLSIKAVLKDIFGKIFKKKNRKVETSLIDEFAYPKLGPGQLWDITAAEFKRMGGKIVMNAKVVELIKKGDRLTGLVYEQNGKRITVNGDYIISSMPVKDLVLGMNGVPDKYREIAEGLPYRDYMTVGVLTKKLNLKNETKIKTIGNIVPDNWVYVHDRSVKMGLAANESDILDFHVERVKKAYPAYFDTYDHMDELRDYLNTIPNLFCVGRNGQHRYNNIDHSMCTSFETVKNILSGDTAKDNIWNVNTEMEYHEEKEA